MTRSRLATVSMSTCLPASEYTQKTGVRWSVWVGLEASSCGQNARVFTLDQIYQRVASESHRHPRVMGSCRRLGKPLQTKLIASCAFEEEIPSPGDINHRQAKVCACLCVCVPVCVRACVCVCLCVLRAHKSTRPQPTADRSIDLVPRVCSPHTRSLRLCAG